MDGVDVFILVVVILVDGFGFFYVIFVIVVVVVYVGCDLKFLGSNYWKKKKGSLDRI